MTANVASADFFVPLHCLYKAPLQLFSTYECSVYCSSSLHSAFPFLKGDQPKQPLKGKKKNHLITDDVAVLHFTMKNLQEASLLLSLIPISCTEFNTKINIFWDTGLGDCSLATKFF